MQTILHHNGVRVQGSTDSDLLLVSAPSFSFEIPRDRVDTLVELFGVAMMVTTPKSPAPKEGADIIMLRRQAD